jgi:hypothetical protein
MPSAVRWRALLAASIGPIVNPTGVAKRLLVLVQDEHRGSRFECSTRSPANNAVESFVGLSCLRCSMSFHTGRYSIEELLALRDSPLVTKPELPPQMEQWINQPALERRNLQNAQAKYHVPLPVKQLTLDTVTIPKERQSIAVPTRDGHV